MTTQRPWSEAKMGNDHQGLVIEEDTGRNVAVAYDKVDARLLAAAPDLLAALERAETALIACGEYLPIGSDADTLAPIAMREASRAIARAKGSR